MQSATNTFHNASLAHERVGRVELTIFSLIKKKL